MAKAFATIWLALFLSACASQSLTPKSEEVKASRKEPSSNCQELGRVTGTTTSVKGSAEDVLEDMKREAAAKGANYVLIGQYSGMNTSVTGTAYKCP